MNENSTDNNDNDSYGMIIPPNNLKKKVKITIVKDGKESEAIENAELAMAAMSGNFKVWLQDEVNKFDAARKAMCEEKSTKNLSKIYIVAHDVKGQAETMGYPLITLVAGSLCKLIEVWENPKNFPLDQLNNHVDAIKIMLTQDITSKDHPMGRKLTEGLLNVVYDYVDEIEAKQKK